MSAFECLCTSLSRYPLPVRVVIHFHSQRHNETDGEETAQTWMIGPTRNACLQWGSTRGATVHRCPHCFVDLLTGERPGFCCGKNGKYSNDPPGLPPLPSEFDDIIQDPNVSALSRLLNIIFSFAALESSHEFPPLPPGGPAFVAMQGRLYHRVRPTHRNSALRWVLYDGFAHEAFPHSNSDWARKIPTLWIETVRRALLRVNPFIGPLLFLAGVDPTTCPTAHIRLDSSGPGNEIAAIFNYNNTTLAGINARQSVVVRHDGENQYVSTISRLWEPLAYPILFPHGTLGWGVVGTRRDLDSNEFRVGVDTVQLDADGSGRQIMFYRARVLRETRFRIFGKLTNEYAVDMLTRNLECRLNYICENQKHLREEDAELMGEPFIPDSQNIYLPASFMGSRRWATEQIADSLTIAAHAGNPTFFVTMTCNSEWSEITSRLRPGQNFSDIPCDVIRVFKQKLSLLEQSLKIMFPCAGRVLYMIHSIEFQKRGLPHAHILCKFTHDCIHPDDIDSVISAEMPTDPADALLVRRLMVHRHPSSDRPASRYCQREKDGQRVCRFGYPQPLQDRTTVDSEGRVHYRRRKPGDEWVVPHCLPLIRNFACHINFEAANPSHLFQYIFKYIHKSSSSFKFSVSFLIRIPSMSYQVQTTQTTLFVLQAMTMSLSTKLMIIGEVDTFPRVKHCGASWDSISQKKNRA